MNLEEILGQRYQIVGRLPAWLETHARFVVQNPDSAGERWILSYCAPAQPMSPESILQQRRLIELMVKPPVALLGRVVEADIQPDYQMVISEIPGEQTLRELLQTRQALSIEETEAFLRMLTEACESAATHGWPRLPMEMSHLYLDGRIGLPRIAVPDVPLLEEGDTIIPVESRDYVKSLAALCCELLGQPQSLRSGNVRYQFIAQLSASQNAVLRRALTSEDRMDFSGVRVFMNELFSQQDGVTPAEKMRTLTETMTSEDLEAISADAVTVRFTVPAVRQTSSTASGSAPLTVLPDDRALAAGLSPIKRLRLLPDSEDAPVFTLVNDEWLTMGRSAAEADFIAQFRPRSNVNDGRSRRISRAQTRLQLHEGRLMIEESGAVNPSLYEGTIIPGKQEAHATDSFMLAGLYPIDVRYVASDYKTACEVRDWPQPTVTGKRGSLIISAGGSGVFLCEAAMIFSDVGLHFSKSGRPWFRAETNTRPVARIHLIAGQFWLEPVEANMVARRGGAKSKRHELILLNEGTQLRIGPYGYTAQKFL
ncbi:MAG: hypothetical protein RL693_1752 [Verrucomicrobiota bacterium]|jgi:hypothetical protein